MKTILFSLLVLTILILTQCQKEITGTSDYKNQTIFFLRNNSSTYNLKMESIQVDGSYHRQLSSDSSRYYFSLNCSNDGNRVIFTKRSSYWVANHAFYQWDKNSNQVDSLFELEGYNLGYVTWNEQSSNYLIGLDDRIYLWDQQNLLTPLTDETQSCWAPVWSPDFKKIAYFCSKSGETAVFTMNSDGSEKTQISLNLSTNTYGPPTWSEDGTLIGFMERSGYEQPYHIWICDLEGNTSERFYSTYDRILDLSFAPKGREILFAMEDADFYYPQLYVLDLLGVAPRRVTYDTFLTNGKWLADGQTILLLSGLDGYDNFYTIKADGTELTQITFFEDENEIHAWATSP